MTEVVVGAAVELLVAVAAGMTRNVVADVVEDQTSHYWPDFSEASAAEIHFDPLPLSQSQKLPRIVLYTASLPGAGAPSGSPRLSMCGADLLGCRLRPCARPGSGSVCCRL